MDRRRPRVVILYHFMFPDDVVSAHHLDGLAQDLVRHGWEVEALPCNRGCRDEHKTYAKSDTQEGVKYRRIWRPGFSQKSFLGRLANSAWMIVAWSMIAFRWRANKPDVVIIGTDPMFGVAAAIPIKFFARDIKIAHWCFDLHPEAAFASGYVNENGLLAKLTRSIMRRAYRACDLIADIGPCMRRRLKEYNHSAQEIELTPWALKEPDEPASVDAETRRELFGNAKLGLLYSGNFGEAHEYETLLQLARNLRQEISIHLCFALRGNRAHELKDAVTEADTNISFAGFASLEDLEKRLGAADIHIVTLRDEWAGIAVPSKFFGSLSVGRPVLYAGPRNSAIGSWITNHSTGLILSKNNLEKISEELKRYVVNRSQIDMAQSRSHSVYKSVFSRTSVTEKWNRSLRLLLAPTNTEIMRT